MHTGPIGQPWKSISLYMTRPMQPHGSQTSLLFRLNAPALSGPPKDTVIFSGVRTMMASHTSGSSGPAPQSPFERPSVPVDMLAEPDLPFLPNPEPLRPNVQQQLEMRQRRKRESLASGWLRHSPGLKGNHLSIRFGSRWALIRWN